MASPCATPRATSGASAPTAGPDRADANRVDATLEQQLRAEAGVHDTGVIVTFDSVVDASVLRSVDKAVGEHVDAEHTFRNVAGIATRLDDHEIARLARDPDVARIEPDRRVTLPPDDGPPARDPGTTATGVRASGAHTAGAGPIFDPATGPEGADAGYAAAVATTGVDGDAARDAATV